MLCSWYPAHCSVLLNPTTRHHHLPASFLPLCTCLACLVCQSPSFCHLHREYSCHFPWSNEKPLPMTTWATQAPEPWSEKRVKHRSCPVSTEAEKFWLKNNSIQLHCKSSRATAHSWTSFFYLFIIYFNWSYLMHPFYRIPRPMVKELALFGKGESDWNWPF